MATRSYALGLHRGAHRRLMWIGGAVLGAAAVGAAVFFIAKPVINTSPTGGNGIGTYWWSLSDAQKATYKQNLWSKLQAVSPWPGNVQSLSSAGINSQSDLDNLENLTAATDDYQTINQLSAQDGAVNAETFASVNS